MSKQDYENLIRDLFIKIDWLDKGLEDLEASRNDYSYAQFRDRKKRLLLERGKVIRKRVKVQKELEDFERAETRKNVRHAKYVTKGIFAELDKNPDYYKNPLKNKEREFKNNFTEAANFWQKVRKSAEHKKATEPNINDYVHSEWITEKENIMENKTLYKIKKGDSEEVYGHFLTKDSQGLSVFEVKGGNGGVIAATEKEFEKVLPHTIGITFGGTEEDDYQIYHYFAKPEQFSVNDIIITSNSYTLARVVAVDTKAESATKYLTGFILGNAKPIVCEDNEESSLNGQ